MDSNEYPYPSAAIDIFGDPEVIPRIGDQYQVQLSPLITKSNYILCMKNPLDVMNKSKYVFPYDFLIGLPIPITWVTNKAESEHLKEGCLVPGISYDSWTQFEKNSFLLGLYIFDKNFVQVKRFVESKKMEDILGFYYGKFFGSSEYKKWYSEYKKWSARRKSRRKKSVYGDRIFRGRRQQELLSRIFPHVSDECRNVLVEVSKTYNDQKVSLEEFVSTLKSMVGMKVLFDVVGIGKGKKDLTSSAFELSKSARILTTRPEIPMGKACSSLKPDQIMKLLTGDFRLSKARSSDLFWEAVWPLLLAQGWHSEEGSKNTLVFLIPGIEKFSRRLLRGTHYFDSLSDVLSKVASQPKLLHDEKSETESEGNDTTEPHRHCYLQRKIPFHTAKTTMELTMVDTSMPLGKTCMVREFTSLPCESTSVEEIDINGMDDHDSPDCDNAAILNQKVEMNVEDTKDSILKRTYLDLQSAPPVNKHNILSDCGNMDTDKKETADILMCDGAPELCQISSRSSPILPLFDLNYPPLWQVEEEEFENCKEYTNLGEQNGMNRRQSTRKRPPTARALEALANGFLTAKSRRKNNKYAAGF